MPGAGVEAVTVPAVLVLGAGGAAANNFIRALDGCGYRIIGANHNKEHLPLSDAPENFHLDRRGSMLGLVERERVAFVHAQPDRLVSQIALLRDDLLARGCRTYLPATEDVVVCQNKAETARRIGGVAAPMVGDLWVRPTHGAGGKDAYRVEIPRGYMAQRYIEGASSTVQMLWYEGELLYWMYRRRDEWTGGDRGASARTTIAAGGEAAGVACLACCRVAATVPHGIWGVDMIGDVVTEINIGRFNTTSPRFSARLGVNVAEHYVEVGLGRREPTVLPSLEDKVGWSWVRQYDREPVLVAP